MATPPASLAADPGGSAIARLTADLPLRCLQAVALGAPLVVAPQFLSSAVDLPKRLWVGAFVAGAVAVWLADGLCRGRIVFHRTALTVPLAAWAAGLGLAATTSLNAGLAWEEVAHWAILATCAWMVSATLSDGEYRRLLGALLLAGGLEAAYGILQYAGIEFLPWQSSWGSRCFGTAGNPVFFAEFLAPVFVLAGALWLAERDEERKDLLALLALALFLALLFSQTRSAWLGAAAGLAAATACVAFAVPDGRSLLSANRGPLLIAAAFVAAVLVTMSSPAMFGRHALPVRERLRDAVDFSGWSVQHRIALWRAGGMMLRDHPLFGVGPDHYHAHFPLKQAEFRRALVGRNFHFAPKERRAHNDYVQTAAETGIVGVGLFVWVLVAIVRLGIFASGRPGSTPQRRLLAAGLLGSAVSLIVDASLNFPFRTVPASVAFWIVAGGLGLLGARDPGGRGSAVPAPGPRWLRWAAAAGVVTAALGSAAWVADGEIRADRARAEGDRYFGSDMWEMAVGSYRRSLASRPYDALVRYRLAVSLDRAARYDWTGHGWDRALAEYKTARKLGLNDELLYGQMALLYERKGNLKRTVEAAERSYAIYPENMDHAANLAYWYAKRGRRLDRALELSSRALASSPEHPLYLWMHALVLERRGSAREAYEAMRRVPPNLPRLGREGAGYEPEVRRDLARLRGAVRRDR